MWKLCIDVLHDHLWTDPTVPAHGKRILFLPPVNLFLPLCLTKANHVIHFDRWWNPAVENQATDRAFRIGQKKDVIVHKFVSQGTIEEKIDAMLESKKELAENVIGSGSEKWITELSNEELFSLLRLE